MERKEKVITLRLKSDGGAETDLYNRIEQGKALAGMSMPDYVKGLLQKHFTEEQVKEKQEVFFAELKKLHGEYLKKMEQMMKSCMIEHNTVIIGALAKLVSTSNEASAGQSQETQEIREAELPQAGNELPEESQSILGMFE